MKYLSGINDEIFSRSILLLKMLSARDKLTAQHSIRVAYVMQVLAMEFVDTNMDLNDCFYASLLHDIGKILMPGFVFENYIIKKEEEFMHIKKHPIYSREILKNQNFGEDITQVVFSHHERCDGSGYPRGISEADIPKAAKLLAIVDSFCAITEDRPYRKARSVEDALSILSSCRGQYDPGMLITLINNADYIINESNHLICEFGKVYCSV